jgi:Na+-transporting NADH:ubiquinone oxidoreductase subunit A
MAEFKLKKGYDIRLTGDASKEIETLEISGKYAIKPVDFRLLKPKLSVEVDQKVKAGQEILFNKEEPRIKFTAPVSGKVVAINRGERRYINEVVIEADKEQSYVEFNKYDASSLEKASSEDLVNQLLESGLWLSIIERPFGTMASPDKNPRDIFISCFDTAPLASDLYMQLKDQDDNFQMGINVLAKLTDGDIHLGLDGNRSDAPSAITACKNIKIHKFSGLHPAGNVGVQIHHIKPINRGDVVWTLKPSDVIAIGQLFKTGYLNSELLFSVAGENITTRKYYKANRGVDLSRVLNGIKENSRIISGTVLTGKQVANNGFLGFYDSVVSVIPEGNEAELLGWVLPGMKKESYSGTYLSKFFRKKEYSHNTNLHGGHRSFVLTGYYEQVLPMDVYPVHLLKSIMCEDVEEMEGLGIYEIIEEDLALCEYICPSKVDVQEIVSDGIELMIRES